MAYMVRKGAHRPWPVTIELHVADEAGEVVRVEQGFVGHFAAFSEAEHEGIGAEIDRRFPQPEDGKERPRSEILRRNAAYFAKVLRGWSGLADENGVPLPYSEAALEVLVTGPDGFALSAGLFQAIAEIRFGGAPLKNFVTSVVPGDSPSASEVGTTATAPT